MIKVSNEKSFFNLFEVFVFQFYKKKYIFHGIRALLKNNSFDIKSSYQILILRTYH